MNKIKIDQKQKKLIEENPLALSTSGSGDKPNVIVVACVKVVADDKILITDNYMNKTKKNLLKNPWVAIAIWSKDWETSYQFKGRAQYLTSGKWKQKVDKDPNNKGLAHKAAILVKVTEIWDLADPKLIAKI